MVEGDVILIGPLQTVLMQRSRKFVEGNDVIRSESVARNHEFQDEGDQRGSDDPECGEIARLDVRDGTLPGQSSRSDWRCLRQ